MAGGATIQLPGKETIVVLFKCGLVGGCGIGASADQESHGHCEWESAPSRDPNPAGHTRRWRSWEHMAAVWQNGGQLQDCGRAGHGSASAVAAVCGPPNKASWSDSTAKDFK